VPKYIKVSRSDTSGSYTQEKSEILNAIAGEFDDESLKVGTSVSLTVVEMTEEEYKNLPEFMGW